MKMLKFLQVKIYYRLFKLLFSSKMKFRCSLLKLINEKYLLIIFIKTIKFINQILGKIVCLHQEGGEASWMI